MDASVTHARSGPPPRPGRGKRQDGPYIRRRKARTDLKVGHYKPRERRPPQKAAATKAAESGQEDLGFGFDDEEGVGVGMAVGAELLEGVIEGRSEDGEDYGAVVSADEVEAALLLNELKLCGHVVEMAA